MAEPPRPPSREILILMEVITFVILLVQVFRSHEPSSFKLGIGVLLLLALYTFVIFHMGRRYEWSRRSGGEDDEDGPVAG